MQPLPQQFLLPLIVLLASHSPARARLLQGADQHAFLVSGAEWSEARRAGLEDQHYWNAQWSAMESELLQLEEAASQSVQSQVMGLAQVGNASRAKMDASQGKQMDASQAKVGNASQGKQMDASQAKVGNASQGKHRASPLTGLKLNLNPKSPADLLPAMAMLKGLYEQGKERIAGLNAREKKSKQDFAERQASHAARLAHIGNSTLSKAFKANETRDEDRLFSYWERVRERQHSQFHNMLKIQHATLEKVKTMIGKYEEAIAGKTPKAKAPETAVVPEVVLLQDAWKATARYCRGALAAVRTAATELGATAV